MGMPQPRFHLPNLDIAYGVVDVHTFAESEGGDRDAASPKLYQIGASQRRCIIGHVSGPSDHNLPSY